MNADDLSESLRLPKDRGTHLVSIRQAVGNVWDIPLLDHYTNHGVDHSRRIIHALEGLLQEHPDLLNGHERFVLLAAVHLHDIGMQSPRHAGLPVKARHEYTLEDLEAVRKDHHEASARMIHESLSGQLGYTLGLEQSQDYAEFIATLCRYHRTLDTQDLADASFAGDPVRIPLLVALLRLGDELDADFRRVNMHVLKRWDIPLESKRYWWYHYYVQSVQIEKGAITLHFRFPKQYQGDDFAEAVRQGVHESVRSQFMEVYDTLDTYGVRLYRDVKLGPDTFRASGLEPLPEDVLAFIREAVLTIEQAAEEATILTGAAYFVDGVAYSDNTEVVESLARVMALVTEGRNRQAAEETERCRILVMAPKDQMILSIIAGNCYATLGQMSQAEECYRDALRISDRHAVHAIYKEEAIATRSAALGNIGLIYSDKGDLDQALQYLKDALDIDRDIGYRQGEANQLGNIGLIYRAKGDLDQALQYLKDALDIHREVGYRQGEASALGNIGLIYSDKGDLDQALQYLNQALSIFAEAAPHLYVQVLTYAAAVHLQRECPEECFQCFAEAISRATSRDQYNVVVNSLLQIARQMASNGQWDALEKVRSICASRAVEDKSLNALLAAISEYAAHKSTGDDAHKKKDKAARRKLSAEMKKVLDAVVK